METLRTQKAAHERAWLAINGVVGVGIGVHSNGAPGIVVSLERDSEQVRREVEHLAPGVRLEFRVTGMPQAG